MTPIIVASAGGVVAIVGGIIMAGGSKKIQDAEKWCPDRQCPVVPATDPNYDAIAKAKDDGNAGRTEVRNGAVIAGVGVAVLAGGLIWYFAQPRSPAAPPVANKATFAPSFGPGFAGVSLSGAF